MSPDLRRRRLCTALAAGLGALAMPGAWAGLVETIARIRPSLVAVGTYLPTRNPAFQVMGTGFAVGDGLSIITNAHVVSQALDTDQFERRVIAVPEGTKARVREVTLAATDPTHDLAILRLSGPPLPAMTLGDASSVREGQEIAIAGFPLGNVLGLFPVTHHGIVSAIAPIGIPALTAGKLDARLVRQLAEGSFDIFQLDITAYPGNSGSPLFIPDTGVVVGVVNSVLVKGARESALTAPTGITYAIPVRHIADLLRTVR